MIASTPGRAEIARYLCSQRINLDLLDNKARTALYLAVEIDNFEVAEILAANGASIIADHGRLAKMLCSIGHENDIEKLRFLVKSDTDIDAADYDKRTVGHLAAAEGHWQILEFLAVNSKFDFNLADRWGTTVLDELKNEELKQRLLKLISSRSARKGSYDTSSSLEKSPKPSFDAD